MRHRGSRGRRRDKRAFRRPDSSAPPAERRVRRVGLIGMKAGRFLAGRRFLGWGNPGAFDEHYDKELLTAKLTAFQRSYAYVLAHGLDAVNADMQTWQHFRENHLAATEVGQRYFA